MEKVKARMQELKKNMAGLVEHAKCSTDTKPLHAKMLKLQEIEDKVNEYEQM